MTRREWAAVLGSVCSPSFPAEAVEALVDMLALLTDFPDAAFNAETVNAIGRSKRRQAIPSLDEVSRILGDWCRDHLPGRLAIDGPPRKDGLPPLDAASRSWLATWQNARAAGFSPECHPFNGRPTPRYSDVHPDTPDNHRRAHLASLMRHCSPAAWAHIQAGQAG